MHFLITIAVILTATVEFALAIPLHNMKARYDGHIVIRMRPETHEQLEMLAEMAAAPHPGLDFWRPPSNLNRPVDLHLASHVINDFILLIEEHGIPYNVTISNLQRLVEAEQVTRRKRSINANFFDDYRSYSEIMTYLTDFSNARNCRGLCSLEVIGKSYENRDLKLLKIGYPRSNGQKKPIIWIDGGIHAREWISPATALYIGSKLVERRAEQQMRTLLASFDFYVLPLVNPDGYEFSFTTDRMWRRTRSRTRDSHCRGVDANRNFNFHYSEVGSESSPCSDVFHGPRPFSEPETAALSNYILAQEGRVKAYLALHSYGQYWLSPWGWTRQLPDDYSQLQSKAQKAIKALRSKYRTQYEFGTSTNVLYPSSGGADDWAKGVAGVPYSYTVELRDQGNQGFLLDRSQIRPAGEETFDAVSALAASIHSEFRF